MTDKFAWADLSGVAHQLDSFAPIQNALDQVVSQLKRYEIDLRSEHAETFRTAVTQTDKSIAHYNKLVSDLQAFDVFARTANARSAQDACVEIGATIAAAVRVRLLHSCWDEWERLTAASVPGATASLLNLPATDLQRQVIDKFHLLINGGSGTTASRAQVMDAIIANPETCRVSLPASVPAFVAYDREGREMETRSLMEIEREYLVVVDEIAALLPRLQPDRLGSERARALAALATWVGRTSVIERGLKGWAAHLLLVEKKAARERAAMIGKL